MVRCLLQFVVKKTFFSARHNRIVKNVKIGETIFQVFFFFRENFFIEKSNNEESKHNDKTQTENETRSKKKKSKENQLLFEGFFFKQKQGDKGDIFQKRV